MARNINDLYNFLSFVVRKTRGAFLTVDEGVTAINTGQLDCFEGWFKPYGQTQVIHDALRPFRIYQPFTSNSSGFVTYPDDYAHLLGQPFTVFGSTVNRIVLLNEDELPFALTSQLRPVTNDYPIAVDSATGFSIYPQTTQTGAYFYLKMPPNAVLDYTQVGRVVTYNPAGSTQLLWADQYINNILARALSYIGVNMDEKGVYDFSMQYKAETT